MYLNEFFSSAIGIAWALFVGACAGSFAMAWADREELPKGRSRCDGCKKELGPVELIPIFGWLVRRGKCPKCKAKISPRYPLFELAIAVIFALITSHLNARSSGWGLMMLIVVSAGMLTCGAAMAIVDWRTMILPPRMNMGFFAFASIYALVAGATEVFDVWTAIIGAIISWAFFWFINWASKGKWLGMGDVKLAPSMGLLVGPLGFFMAVASASYIAFAYVIGRWALAKGNMSLRGMRIAFGPFLLLGLLVVYIGYDQILNTLGF